MKNLKMCDTFGSFSNTVKTTLKKRSANIMMTQKKKVKTYSVDA